VRKERKYIAQILGSDDENNMVLYSNKYSGIYSYGREEKH